MLREGDENYHQSDEEDGEDLDDDDLANKDARDLHQNSDYEPDSFVINDSDAEHEEALASTLLRYHSAQLSSEDMSQDVTQLPRRSSRQLHSQLREDKGNNDVDPSPTVQSTNRNGKCIFEYTYMIFVYTDY